MNPSVERNDRDTGARGLKATTNLSSDRPSKKRSKEPVNTEGVGVLALDTALVLPWNALRICSELAEAVGYPWVTLEILLQEVKVFNFLLLGWIRRWAHFQNLISFLGQLIKSLASFVIEAIFAESVVVCGIELAWHAVRI